MTIPTPIEGTAITAQWGADVADRLNSGWIALDSGSVSGAATFDIAVPAGYDALRVRMHGSTSGTTGVSCRINNITSSAYDQWSDGAGSVTTRFGIGAWQNRAFACGLDLLIEGAGGAERKAWSAHSWRRNVAKVESFGATVDSIAAVTLLTIFPESGTISCAWTLDGYKAAS